MIQPVEKLRLVPPSRAFSVEGTAKGAAISGHFCGIVGTRSVEEQENGV
jgi:hypothetical protein